MYFREAHGHEFGVQLQPRSGCSDEMEAGFGVVAGGQRIRVLYAAAIFLSEDLSEYLIDARDQRVRAAEIGGEMDGIKKQREVAGNFKPQLLGARKKLGVGIAKEVDGLHGVADDEAGAALALGPGCDEMREQLMLAAAGVLEFVDQQVTNAVGNSERALGG